ncbi:MAG: ComEA family DNA-binding protein [Oscillospiraceae bacterium]|nr:ComEA family DNA-binding protein [Oscillospiraceae bacterium]
MKISGVERGVLIATAVFLLGTAGFFLSRRWNQESYTVQTQALLLQTDQAQQEEQQEETQVQELVNINTADTELLETLPGIGPVKAQAIVDDREENGPFTVVEELIRVPGIGESTLEGLLDYITVE